jgi:hypothetical protein
MALKPDQLKAVTSAKKAVMEGQLTLWNLRLDAAVAAGSTAATLERLGAAVEDAINNCGCNVQCGAREAVGGAIANPMRG